MSTSDRRFSVTLSEDDLRPHMRKPKPPSFVAPVVVPLDPKPSTPLQNDSEILALQKKAEKREEVKREVKRRIEEEEREKEKRKREEMIRRETEQLLLTNTRDSQDIPKLGRRYNNSQYFNWTSDEDLREVRPISRRTPSPFPRRLVSTPSRSPRDTCEFCTLAMRGVPTKSAACSHVDAFLASNH